MYVYSVNKQIHTPTYTNRKFLKQNASHNLHNILLVHIFSKTKVKRKKSTTEKEKVCWPHKSKREKINNNNNNNNTNTHRQSEKKVSGVSRFVKTRPGSLRD